MEEKRISIVVAYTPEEYAKIFSVSEDRDEIDKDWEQWRQAADEKKSEAALQGAEYVEQYIDYEGLFRYCLMAGRPMDARARSDYAHALYDKQSRESLTLPGKVEVETPSPDQVEEEGLPPAPAPYSYTPPVDKLLTYTDIEGEDPLPAVSYVEKFGFGPEHIPELIRMATDDYLLGNDANEFEFAAPLHAVSALAELHAEEAIEPLLMLYDKLGSLDHDWMEETLLDVFTTLGPVALPAIEQFLADPSHHESALNYVGEIVGRIAEAHPEARAECLGVVTRRLEEFEKNNPELNACLICDLIKMKAVEAAPLIEEAFANDSVDESWCGDWEEVQYQLGLKERPASKNPWNILADRLRPAPSPTPTSSTNTVVHTTSILAPKPKKKSPPTKKAKAKMANASRKANRRKR